MEEKILYLPLKKKWYEMIESYEKPEEYVQRGFSILKKSHPNRFAVEVSSQKPPEA